MTGIPGIRGVLFSKEACKMTLTINIDNTQVMHFFLAIVDGKYYIIMSIEHVVVVMCVKVLTFRPCLWRPHNMKTEPIFTTKLVDCLLNHFIFLDILDGKNFRLIYVHLLNCS